MCILTSIVLVYKSKDPLLCANLCAEYLYLLPSAANRTTRSSAADTKSEHFQDVQMQVGC